MRLASSAEIWQFTYALLVRGGDHIAIGLLVVRDGLDTKHLAQLVNQLTLLAIHGRKRVTTRFLLTLLGQFNQIAERLVDTLRQSRVPLGKAARELRVLGKRLQLRVRIARLQTNGQATIALKQTTLIIAVQPGYQNPNSI